jgi:hypothetical protein
VEKFFEKRPAFFEKSEPLFGLFLANKAAFIHEDQSDNWWGAPSNPKWIESRLDRVLYSFPDVVHRLGRGLPVCPATQPVNNVVAEPTVKVIFISKLASRQSNLGSALVRTSSLARATSMGRPFDQSRNPNADTHTQVPTINVSPYTDCAPRSLHRMN